MTGLILRIVEKELGCSLASHLRELTGRSFNVSEASGRPGANSEAAVYAVQPMKKEPKCALNLVCW
jgi:hypothetical protein